MSDKDKIKNASHNVIDLMSKFGKQFLSEAIDQGEPILDLFNNLAKGEAKGDPKGETRCETKKGKNDNLVVHRVKDLQINDLIRYDGPENIFKDLVETDTSYTVLFNLPGVNRQDFILEKNDTSLEIFCKTSIADSRILGFKYKEREIRFTLKIKFAIECLNILAELKDGLLKIDIEKSHQETDDELITLV